jgi:hypothetical protein
MTATARSPIAVGLDDYLTDGTRLFRVIDVVRDEAALLEDAYDEKVAWQSLDELARASLRRIVPTQLDVSGGDHRGHGQADPGGKAECPAGTRGGEA